MVPVWIVVSAPLAVVLIKDRATAPVEVTYALALYSPDPDILRPTTETYRPEPEAGLSLATSR